LQLSTKHIESFKLSGDDLLFSTEHGFILKYSNWHQRHWILRRKAAGLAHVGFDDLRRANATALVASGVDVKTAHTRLGRSDALLILEVNAQATSEGDPNASYITAEKTLGDRIGTPVAPIDIHEHRQSRKAKQSLEPDVRLQEIIVGLTSGPP